MPLLSVPKHDCHLNVGDFAPLFAWMLQIPALPLVFIVTAMGKLHCLSLEMEATLIFEHDCGKLSNLHSNHLQNIILGKLRWTSLVWMRRKPGCQLTSKSKETFRKFTSQRHQLLQLPLWICQPTRPDPSVLEAPIEFKLIRPVCTRSSCELLLRTNWSVRTVHLQLLFYWYQRHFQSFCFYWKIYQPSKQQFNWYPFLIIFMPLLAGEFKDRTCFSTFLATVHWG